MLINIKTVINNN